MKRLTWLVGLGAWLATGLAAQDPPPKRTGSPWYVHYGKWLAATGAIAFTVVGAQEHDKSNTVYGNLLDHCRADDKNCALNPSGTYIDPAAEEMYQSSLSYDRRARARLIAGQASLLLCAGLFVADLRHKGPENIPVHGMQAVIDPLRGTVGLRMKF